MHARTHAPSLLLPSSLTPSHRTYRIELYTEVAIKATQVKGFPGGDRKRLDTPLTYSPDGPERLSDFHQAFGSDKLDTTYVNAPLLTTIGRMIECDCLITSRSSLSACAAYLKREEGTLVIYHPFWHNMLSAVEDGHVASDDPKLKDRVGEWARKRGSSARSMAAERAEAVEIV